jgi:hypothetical protein
MKKTITLVPVFLLTLTFTSIANNPDSSKDEAPLEVVERMTNDLCKAMELYDPKDPNTMAQCTKALENISGKDVDYEKVTEEQIKVMMEHKCPEGYKKLMELVDGELK